uniref:PH domain-containing protein n=1 Tax=Syphacia muris TaxID=451379 RepID=A0A0N5AQ58_9BILA
MGKQIPLEDLMSDTPQQRNLMRLFEEDTYNLRIWGHKLSTAIEEWCHAQKLILKATAGLASVVMSYGEQKFPLEETAYDIPAITNRLAQTFNEINGWMEVFMQQIECCVQYPVRKINDELDNLVEVLRPDVASAFSNLAEAEDKFLKLSKKDTARKIEDASHDVFLAKTQYNKLAMDYCGRMNVVQTNRYIQFIEPMLAMMYAYKSLFNVGHDAFRSEFLTSFLTQAQQQMQEIDKNSEDIKRSAKAADLSQNLIGTLKAEHDLCYDESLMFSQPHLSDAVQKQGYLRIKLKGSFFMSNWEKYFVYTQGASLMWQKPDQLIGSLMIDLSSAPGCSAEVAKDQVERRFVFNITVQGGCENRNEGEKKWYLQARNAVDMHEWIDVINNLTGTHPKMQEKKETSIAGEETFEVKKNATTDKFMNDEKIFSEHESSDLTLGQPIQFDFLSLSSTPDIHVNVNELSNDVDKFEVRFLGSVEVLCEEKKKVSTLVQSAIERVLNARKTHSISESILCVMVICNKSKNVMLLDHEKEDDIKAVFPISDVLCSTTYSDERIFALVTKAQSAEEGLSNDSLLKCSILSTIDTSEASDVCRALEKMSITNNSEMKNGDGNQLNLITNVDADQLNDSPDLEDTSVPMRKCGEDALEHAYAGVKRYSSGRAAAQHLVIPILSSIILLYVTRCNLARVVH